MCVTHVFCYSFLLIKLFVTLNTFQTPKHEGWTVEKQTVKISQKHLQIWMTSPFYCFSSDLRFSQLIFRMKIIVSSDTTFSKEDTASIFRAVHETSWSSLKMEAAVFSLKYKYHNIYISILEDNLAILSLPRVYKSMAGTKRVHSWEEHFSNNETRFTCI